MAKPVLKGTIVEWNPKSPFGYADADGQRVFLHISNFTERARWPEETDKVSFQMGLDAKGRPCAQNIVLAASGSVLKWHHLLVLALLLVLPAMASTKLDECFAPWWIAFCMFLTSSMAALNLWLDKHFSMKSRSRVPEATLHLFELAGGWPGSFLAQRVFRHKISKRNYQIFFWLIVIIYQLLAVDLIFGGFLASGLHQLSLL